MTAWIAIIISSIVLVINAITQRDKLLSFFDELKDWFAERNERKKALEVINGFANSDFKQQPSLLAIYIPIFLISTISSVVLNYLGYQPQFYNTILLSGSIYLSISMIVVVTFLATSRRFQWQLVTGLFILTPMVSGLWGVFVIIFEKMGIEKIWLAGIISGVAVILFMVAADLRASSQARKKKSRSRLRRGKDNE